MKIRGVFLKKGSKKKIAVIRIYGPIIFNRSRPELCPAGWILNQIEEAAQDPNVLGILLEISSPGGAIVPSEIIFSRLRQISHSLKPVVAYITDMGASGGYYIACGANQIVAHPSALVGSIGVIFKSIGYHRLLENLDIEPRVFKSASLKDMGSPFRELTQEDKAEFEALITEFYSNFVNAVSNSRGIATDVIKNTKSKVMTGNEALKISLVNYLGSIDDAMNLLMQMIHNGLGIDPRNLSIIEYQKMISPFASLIGGFSRIMQKFQGINSILGQSVEPGFYYLWEANTHEI